MIKLVDMMNDIKWKEVDDKAKGQADDETKIYDGYIRLFEFSTNAKSNLKYLSIGLPQQNFQEPIAYN